MAAVGHTRQSGDADQARTQIDDAGSEALIRLIAGPWRALRIPFRLFDYLLQGFVDGFRAGVARPLELNHPVGIDDVVSRRAARAPPGGDGTAR